MRGEERGSITGKKLRIGDYVVRHSNSWVGKTQGIVVGFTPTAVAVVSVQTSSVKSDPSIRLDNRYFSNTGRLKKRPDDFPSAKHHASEFAVVTGQEDPNLLALASSIRDLVKQYDLYPDENIREDDK